MSESEPFASVLTVIRFDFVLRFKELSLVREAVGVGRCNDVSRVVLLPFIALFATLVSIDLDVECELLKTVFFQLRGRF